MKTNIYLWSYLNQFFLEWEMFQTKVVKKIKTKILFSVTFFLNRAIAQWARIPKKLAKIQSSTCSLFITFLFAKTSLSSMKKCDLFSLVNF